MSDAETIADYTVPASNAWRRAWTHWRVWRLGGETQAWRRALYRGNATFARDLVEIKASAKGLQSYDMFTALDRRDSRFLKWTLDCGANPNLKHNNNCRDHLLHRAAVRGWMHRTELLLEAGADLNVTDNAHSPLGSCLSGFGEVVAGWEERKPVALRLIAAKPDFTLYHWHDRENDFGSCPFDLEVLEALLKAGCDPFTIYNPAPKSNYEPVDGEPVLLFHGSQARTAQELDGFLKLVQRYGMGPTTLSRDGSTLAWLLDGCPAMGYDPQGTLEVLQQHGYPLLGTNPQGETLLHRAVRHRDVSTLTDVLKAVMDVPGMKVQASMLNHEGLSAMEVLQARSKEHNFQKTKPYHAAMALFRSLALEASFAGTIERNPTPAATKPRL